MIPSLALAIALVAPGARELVEEGQRHYRSGSYAEAAAAFAEAHALDPRPEYLYRWAQAERRAGNCPVAAQLYRRYLDNELPEDNIAAAKKNLARCGHAQTDPDPTPLDTSDTAPEPVPDPPPPAPVDDEPRRWWADPAGTSLVAIGGAGVIVGVGLGLGTVRQLRLAREAAVEEDYIRHAERSEPLRVAAIVTGTVGGALLVGGIIRWVLVARGIAPHRRDTSRWDGLRLRF